MNQNKNAEIKYWSGSICNRRLICDKKKIIIRGFVVSVAEINEGKRKNRGGRKEGRTSGHKLNITNGFTDGFKSIGNSVYKNNTSS